jgi:hypothetical protein
MTPTGHTESLPHRGEAPATSHAGVGSNPVDCQSRAAAVRSRTGLDAHEWGHTNEPVQQAQFDADPVFADQKPASSTTMATQSEHDVTAEIEMHLRASGPRGIEILPAFRNASTRPPITPDSLAELDMPRMMSTLTASSTSGPIWTEHEENKRSSQPRTTGRRWKPSCTC